MIKSIICLAAILTTSNAFAGACTYQAIIKCACELRGASIPSVLNFEVQTGGSCGGADLSVSISQCAEKAKSIQACNTEKVFLAEESQN